MESQEIEEYEDRMSLGVIVKKFDCARRLLPQLTRSVDPQLVKDNKDALISVLTEIFELIDTNADGHVDEAEGTSLGLAMGETAEEAAESWHDMMRDMDEQGDRNGMVELNGAPPDGGKPLSHCAD